MTRTIVSVIASLVIGGAVGSVATQHFMFQVTCSAPDDSAARAAATKRWLGPDRPTSSITSGNGY